MESAQLLAFFWGVVLNVLHKRQNLPDRGQSRKICYLSCERSTKFSQNPGLVNQVSQCFCHSAGPTKLDRPHCKQFRKGKKDDIALSSVVVFLYLAGAGPWGEGVMRSCDEQVHIDAADILSGTYIQREIVYPPIFGYKAFFRGGGWGCVFCAPHAAGFFTPLPFIHAPPLEGYFQEWGGWGCIKFGPALCG